MHGLSDLQQLRDHGFSRFRIAELLDVPIDHISYWLRHPEEVPAEVEAQLHRIRIAADMGDL